MLLTRGNYVPRGNYVKVLAGNTVFNEVMQFSVKVIIITPTLSVCIRED